MLMAKRKKKESSGRPTGATVDIIVRRGALRRFDALKKRTTELPVRVVWDRRLEERRHLSLPSAETRRRAERRQQEPPFTWTVADFVVVDATAPDEESTREPNVRKKQTPARASRRPRPEPKKKGRQDR
jgi:hypothetical protein